ncbi:MAG: RNA polymerase sigma factor [Planctomycetota bacterium]
MALHPSERDPESLLTNTGWMRALARSLVGDDASADDVVQQACLALVRNPPRERHAAGAWLRSVIRRLAYRQHREDSRRRNRERRVARSEAGGGGPSEALDRAELQKTIVTEVLALDEPYRTTVVLRFFEELSPGQVADRLGVPEKTVRTRLARALERLRGRLDAQVAGGRAEWSVLLLPWLAPSMIAVMAAHASAATGAPVSTAVTGSGGAWVGSAAGVPILATGGVIMSKIVVVLVGGASLALGLGVGRYTASGFGSNRELHSQATEGAQEATLRAELHAQVEAVTGELRESEAARDSALMRVRELEEQMAALRTQLEAATTLASPEAEAAAKKLAVAFGEFADMDAFKNADWADMAAAVEGLNALLLDLIEGQKNGEGLPEGFAQKVQRENARLLAFAAAVISKIPTHAPINGEFTHPLATANLMASMLDRADLSISDAQRAAWAQAGESYEQEYARLQAGYGEDSLEMTKLLDELELKRDSLQDMHGALTAEQSQSLLHPELQDRYQLDALSPFISLLSLTQPVAVASRDEAVNVVRSHVARSLQIPETALAGAAHDFDRWAAEVAPILTPISAADLTYMHLNDATTAGRAYERLLQSLSRSLALDDAARARIQNEQGWLVPRLVSQPSGTPPAQD